jgi:hypothetical protein
VTGFPPGTVGHQDIADGAALQARNDATAAYNTAAGEPGCTSTGVELGSAVAGQTRTTRAARLNDMADRRMFFTPSPC